MSNYESDGKLLKALGVALLAAVAAMALAAVAQADPEYYIENSTTHNFFLAGLNLVSGLREGATVATGGFELLVPAISLKLFCAHQKSEGWIKNQVLEKEPKVGDGIGLGTVTFTKCEALEAAEVCKVTEPISTTVKTELILHEVSGKKEPYILFVPDNKAGIFASITITGEECPITMANEPIGGSIAGEVSLGAAVKQQLRFNDSVYKLICTELAKCNLKYGIHPLTWDFTLELELLNGSAPEGFEQNAGKKWEVK